MNRYRFKMEVIVRPNGGHVTDENCPGAARQIDRHEKTMKCNVTAENELVARRCALQQAWDNGQLVSSFLRIKQVQLP